MNSKLQKKWAKETSAALVGRKIVKCRYLTQEEQEAFGWYTASLVIFLDDGTYLIPSTDDEGNGPGALHTNIEGLEIIPVCS